MMQRRKFLIYSSAIVLSEVTSYAYAQKVNLLVSPFQTIFLLYKDLFEVKKTIFMNLRYFFDKEFTPPKVVELSSVEYLAGVLEDSRIEKDHREYILQGVVWLNESSEEMFSKKYVALNVEQREELLQEINQLAWGDNWLYVMMQYYFESMFCAPIYGGNKNKSGWKWLEYEAGYPQPKTLEEIAYE